MNLCIDLCSGLGGFSQAFKDAGWKVVTVDYNQKFNPSLCADITSIDWEEFKHNVLHDEQPDVLLASPDCRYFSIANPIWPRPGVGKALALVGACFEAVAVLKPRFWFIENPTGRLRSLIGHPPTRIFQSDYGRPNKKPTDLWGNIPLPLLTDRRTWLPSPRRAHVMDRLHRDPAKRALIPYELSQAILQSVSEVHRP